MYHNIGGSSTDDDVQTYARYHNVYQKTGGLSGDVRAETRHHNVYQNIGGSSGRFKLMQDTIE